MFMLLMRLGLPAAAAAPVAVEAAILHNFIWHERFTWRDRRGGGMALRLWRFHLGNGFASIAANTLLAWWLVEQWKTPALPTAAVSIAVCAPLNFLVADRWVYRDG
jgi:putative flippase GtrA